MPWCTEPTRLLHRREGRWQAQLGGLRPATGAFRKQPQSTRSARLGSVPVPDWPPNPALSGSQSPPKPKPELATVLPDTQPGPPGLLMTRTPRRVLHLPPRPRPRPRPRSRGSSHRPGLGPSDIHGLSLLPGLCTSRCPSTSVLTQVPGPPSHLPDTAPRT